MQRFVARLSTAVDKTEFERFWLSDPELSGEPKVEFVFAGLTVSAIVHSDDSEQWPSVRFHQCFSAVVRRMNGACNIRWL